MPNLQPVRGQRQGALEQFLGEYRQRLLRPGSVKHTFQLGDGQPQ